MSKTAPARSYPSRLDAVRTMRLAIALDDPVLLAAAFAATQSWARATCEGEPRGSARPADVFRVVRALRRLSRSHSADWRLAVKRCRKELWRAWEREQRRRASEMAESREVWA